MDFPAFLDQWYREHPDVTQARLSLRSGVSQSLLSKYVHSDPQRRATPSPANLRKLAPALGVPYDELMAICGYTDPKAPSEQGAVLLAAAEWTRALQEQGVQPTDWPHAIRTSLAMFRLAGGGRAVQSPLAQRGRKSRQRAVVELRSGVTTGPEMGISAFGHFSNQHYDAMNARGPRAWPAPPPEADRAAAA